MKNYKDWIKQLQKEHGITNQNDLFAMSHKADPFNKGSEADIRDADWFLEMWKKLGFDTDKRVHLRRIHYQLVSLEEDIYYTTWKTRYDPTPVKRLYENTNDDWKYLGTASRAARELGFVPFAAIKDEKNPVPRIGEVDQREDGVVKIVDGDMFDLDLPDYLDFPGYYLSGFMGAQRHYMEIWCEKSTINDILLPLGKEYGISVITSQGFQSLSTAYDFMERSEQFGKPSIIFYISDFDINGESMPNSVSRHIQFMLDCHEKDLDVKLFPIALTQEQVVEYRLPTKPVKNVKEGASQLGRANWEGRRRQWKRKYGDGDCELDALEAIYPGELEKIIKKYILHYYDETLDERVSAAKQEIREELSELMEQTHDTFQQTIDELQNDYSELKDEFEARLDDIKGRLKSCNRDYQNELQRLLETDIFTAPEAVEVGDIEEPLFDSNRSYMEQNEYYQEHKKGRR